MKRPRPSTAPSHPAQLTPRMPESDAASARRDWRAVLWAAALGGAVAILAVLWATFDSGVPWPQIALFALALPPAVTASTRRILQARRARRNTSELGDTGWTTQRYQDAVAGRVTVEPDSDDARQLASLVRRERHFIALSALTPVAILAIVINAATTFASLDDPGAATFSVGFFVLGGALAVASWIGDAVIIARRTRLLARLEPTASSTHDGDV